MGIQDLLDMLPEGMSVVVEESAETGIGRCIKVSVMSGRKVVMCRKGRSVKAAARAVIGSAAMRHFFDSEN